MVKLNKDKSIGNVIFIVEGKRKEPQIIRNIFEKVLGYNIYQYNKNEDIVKLRKHKNIYDKVVIITNNKPQLSCVLNETEFIEKAFETLRNNNLDIYDSAIYYIFDRDYGSNDAEVIGTLMDRFNNSRESSDFDMHGLLLMSYPCVEALHFNCNNDDEEFSSAIEIKKSLNLKKYNHINDENIIQGAEKLIEILEKKFSLKLIDSNLDDFKTINKDILKIEDDYYFKNNVFITLSLVLIALFDLNILELDW